MQPSILQKLIVTYLLLYLPLATCLYGQATITGIITDNDTGAPVELASIFLYHDQSQGTVSNQAGNYAFTYMTQGPSDSLVVSIIGYQSMYLSLADLSDSVINIQLIPSTHILKEVMIVHNEGLKNMVRKAYEKIPENFVTDQYDLQGFYQNYTISDSAYAELIEASVTIRKKKFDREKNDFKIYVHQLRKSDDARNLPERINKFMGKNHSSLHLLLRQDGVRNYCIDCKFGARQTFNKQLSNLEFSGYSESLRGDDTIVLVTFYNNNLILHTPEGPKKMIYGEIAINKSNYAIERIKNGFLLEGYPFFQEMGYRSINGKYTLSYIKSSKGVTYDDGTRTLVNSEVLSIESHTPVKEKIKKKYLLKSDKHLRNFKLKYDEEYWNKKTFPVSATPLEIMTGDLSRMNDLEAQFKNNEKRKGS